MYDGIGTPLVTWDNVLVAPGAVCLDPRLQDILLLDVVREAEVFVVDETGAPIEDAIWSQGMVGSAEFGQFLGGQFWEEHDFEDGRAIVPVAGGQAALLICAYGYLNRLVEVAPGVSTFVLQAAPQITLRVPAEFVQMSAFELGARLAPVDGDEITLSGSRRTLVLPFRSNELTLFPERLGRLSVDIWLTRESPDGGGIQRVCVHSFVRTVDSNQGVRSFVLELPLTHDMILDSLEYLDATTM
jgi:hypothetical protein